MYAVEAQDGIKNVLNEQLEHDTAGELKERLIDELRVAADEITAALGGEPAAADAGVLRGLLEASRLAESVLVEVWSALHHR